MTTPSHPSALSLRLVDWSSLVYSLNWVYEGPVPVDGRGQRTNPDLSAWLIREGQVQVRSESGGTIQAKAGDWVFLPVGQRHQDFSEDALLLSLCWRARWPDGRSLFDHGLPLVFPAEQHPELESAARKLLDFSQRHLEQDPLPTWRLRASVRVTGERFFEAEVLMSTWLLNVTRTLVAHSVFPSLHHIPDERVLLAMETLEYLPLQEHIHVEAVAHNVGLSVSQMNRLFVRYLGHTPKAHLQIRRLTEARNLLLAGDLTVKEVAFHVGFSSPSAFNHWFAKSEGCNPKTFMRRTKDSATTI